MSSRLRSASLGAIPRPKKHFTSRAESAAKAALDVRCACQFFQSNSLLPERINPVGSRPSSSMGYHSRPNSRNEMLQHTQSEEAHGLDSEFSFGFVETTDYYAESVSRPNSPVSSVDHNEILDAKLTDVPDTLEMTNVVVYQEPTPIKQKDPATSRLLRRKSSQHSLNNFGFQSDEPNRGTGHRSLIDQPKPSNLRSHDPAPVMATESIVKQKDPSTSRVLQRRLSSQSKSFDEMKNSSQTDNVIKQRDPSTSSIIRKRLDSQSKSTDDTSKDKLAEISTNKNLLQRDASSSSILRKRLNSQSKSFDECQRPILQENTIKQRDPTTSTFLRKRLASQSQSFDQDQQLKNVRQIEKFPVSLDTQEDLAAPPKKSGRSIFSIFKKENNRPSDDSSKMDTSDTRWNYEQDDTELKELNTNAETLKKDSGRSILSMFKREPKVIQSKDEVMDISCEPQPPIISVQENVTSIKSEQEMCQIIIDPPTSSIESPPIEITLMQQPKIPKMEPLQQEAPTNEQILDENLTTDDKSEIKTCPSEMPEKNDPERKTVTAGIFKSVPMTLIGDDLSEINMNRPEIAKPKDPEPKTVTAGIFKSVPMSLIGDIIHAVGHSTSRSMSREEEEIVIDTETRLFDHYNKDSVATGSQIPGTIQQIVTPSKIVSVSTMSPNEVEVIEEPMPVKKPELIRRSEIIAGFQDEGQITSTPPANVIKQKDPAHSTLLRKRYSQSLDRKQTMGSQNSLKNVSTLRQMDPSQSTLLQKRRDMSRGVSHDRAYSMDSSCTLGDKITKNVSFEFDRQLGMLEPSELPELFIQSDEQPIEDEPKDITIKQFTMRDHEYEPIGEPVTDSTLSNSITVAIAEPQNDDVSPSKTTDDENTLNSNTEELTTKPKLLRSTEIDEIEMVENIGNLQQQNQQYEADASTSVAVDEPVPESESRMKSFLANANHKRKHMNQQLKTQAGKIQTKLKGMKKTKSESPKKTKRKFKAPEFSKLKSIQVPKIKKPEFKRPEFKRPDFKRLEFKRPELTKLKTFEKLGTLKKSDFKFSLPDRPKFSKPEMPKFNISDRFSSFRLHRSKSVKSTHSESAAATGTSTTEDQTVTVPKKRFDFSTYPRIFDRKKKPKPSERDDARDDDTTDSRPQLAMATRVIKKGSPIPTGATTSSFADTESGQFQQYERDSHSLSRDRSPSLDRRMRLDKQDSLNSEEPKEIQTEEQKQFADYDEENRTIHEISKLREHEFRQRKPFVHQESDLVSEESTKDFGWEESEKLRNHQREESESLSQKEDYSTEAIPDRDRDRLSTQEAQSTGSFKKGVIEEIDDDEFFLRKKGISQDDIQIGQYISSAIREGLDTPENALAKLGQYDPYYDEDFDVNNDRPDYGYDVPPSKPRRVKDFKHLETDSFNDDDLSLRYNDDMQDDELFKTFPPKRPLRKSRRQYSNESLEQNNEVPVAAEYYPHPDEDDGSLFEQEHDHNLRFDETLFATIGHGKLDNDFDIDDATVVKPIAPPRAPKRRKKFKGVVIQDQLEDQGRNAMVNGHVNEVLLYRAEHEYIVPLAQPEKMSTPTLASRSRSQVSHITDDDRTSHGADSLAFDDNKFIINIQENNGYAVVKKEPPPRPPAPIRRKRSTRSLGDRQLVTVRRDQNDWDVEHFQRNTRNYSTVGPTRPPRRISVDLDNSQKWLSVSNSDVTQYEEIDDFDKNVEMKKLAHDDVLNKMKYRPLPPPPRPPRERKPKKFPGEPSEEFGDNKKQTAAVSVPIDSTEEDFASDTLNRLSSQEVEEVEASTQTDPLPDDFLCEEFEISDDMKIIEPTIYRKSKTLEDILKEEQQAELERAKQIADEHCLTKSLYKFKEANQKSQSERSRGSTSDRPKTPGSRPITPSAIVIERKTVLPTTETDAKLIVRPIEEPLEEVQSDTNIPDDIKYSEDIVDTEDERIVNEALRRYTFFDEDLRDSSPTFDETERFPILDGGEPVTHRGSTPPTLTVNPSSPVRRTPPSIPITRALTPPVIRPTENSPPPVPDDESIIETEHEQSPPIADEPFDSDANIQKIEAEEAPQPPPRRKSSTTDFGTSQTNQIAEMPIIEELRDRVTPIYPDPPVDLIQQNRMQITDLDVQHLNVNTIQAGRIAVSDLQAAAVNSVDLECKSGDLVVKSIQLPPGFMDELIERIREKEQELKSNQTKTENESAVKTESAVQQESLETQEQPPRPPPPRFDPSEYTSYSIPPPSFFQLRDYDEDLEPPHVPATRRRRHHRRRELSTSEDDHPSRHTPSRPVDPSVLDLTGQLLRACGRSAVETGSKLLNMVKDRSVGKDGKIEANKEVIIIIIVILALMMLSLSSERTVHYHHWDYFNPPDSSASK